MPDVKLSQLAAASAASVAAGVLAGCVLAVATGERTMGLLLGAVVSSTDAAAVFATLRRLPLPRRMAASCASTYQNAKRASTTTCRRSPGNRR